MKDRTIQYIALASVFAATVVVLIVQSRRVAAAEAARSQSVSEALSEQRSWAADRRLLELARSQARLAAESADRDHERWRSYASEQSARAAWSAYSAADSALREHERKKIPPPTYTEWEK